MKLIVVGLIALIGFSVVSGMSSGGMRDFDSASLSVAISDRSKIVVVEFYSDT